MEGREPWKEKILVEDAGTKKGDEERKDASDEG